MIDSKLGWIPVWTHPDRRVVSTASQTPERPHAVSQLPGRHRSAKSQRVLHHICLGRGAVWWAARLALKSGSFGLSSLSNCSRMSGSACGSLASWPSAALTEIAFREDGEALDSSLLSSAWVTQRCSWEVSCRGALEAASITWARLVGARLIGDLASLEGSARPRAELRGRSTGRCMKLVWGSATRQFHRALSIHSAVVEVSSFKIEPSERLIGGVLLTLPRPEGA